MTLKQAAQEFAKANPEFSTQAGALNQCDWASQRFIMWLTATYPKLADYHKVREYSFYLTEKDYQRYEYCDCGRCNPVNPANPDPVTYSGGINESGEVLSPWHVIVETRSHFIDFTAKQYKNSAAYPYIMRKQNLVAGAAVGRA